MARDITTAEQNEMAAALCRPAFLYEGIFDGTPLRLWTGKTNISYGGNTFLGNGWIQSVTAPPEIDEVRATGITIRLGFLSSSLISTLLNNSKGNGTGKLWLGMFDSSWSIVGDGYLLFKGKLDGVDIDYSADGATADIRYESALADLLIPKENRYTDQNQRLFFPDDAGMQYVVQANQWSGSWGIGDNKLGLKRRDRR
jgi:hypothetical protein